MSEYQYYEFQAIDRRLTTEEMARLRSFSTRARITPTSFVNDYGWALKYLSIHASSLPLKALAESASV